MSCVSRGVLTMLSFLGFEILIVAAVHPGRYSSMLHFTVACSSLANVPYDRARLGSNLPRLETRRAGRGELLMLIVLIVLQSNGSGVSVTVVLSRRCETSNAALHLKAIRAVGQTMIFKLAETRTEFQLVAPQSAQLLSKRSTIIARLRDSFHPGHRQQRISPHQACIPRSGHRFRILGSIHLPANALQCELPVQ